MACPPPSTRSSRASPRPSPASCASRRSCSDAAAAVAVALALVLLSLAGAALVAGGVGLPPHRAARRPSSSRRPRCASPRRIAAVLPRAPALVLLAVGRRRRRLDPRRRWWPRSPCSRRSPASASAARSTGCCCAARGGGDGDVRGDLGLDGRGPWLVVLTAPGLRAAASRWPASWSSAAGEREVRAREPAPSTRGPASLPVRSVPAALAVGADGRLREARAGRLDARRARGGARGRSEPLSRAVGARGARGAGLYSSPPARRAGPCPSHFRYEDNPTNDD